MFGSASVSGHSVWPTGVQGCPSPGSVPMSSTEPQLQEPLCGLGVMLWMKSRRAVAVWWDLIPSRLLHMKQAVSAAAGSSLEFLPRNK